MQHLKEKNEFLFVICLKQTRPEKATKGIQRLIRYTSQTNKMKVCLYHEIHLQIPQGELILCIFGNKVIIKCSFQLVS